LVLVVVSTLSIAEKPQTTSSPSESMKLLKNHIDGVLKLDPGQINQHALVIETNAKLIGQTATLLNDAFDLVNCYETKVGPLFMNKATQTGFTRKPEGGLELDRAMFTLQQGLIDYAYTPENVKNFHDKLNGAAFKTAAYFPGAVDAPKDATKVHEVLINASQPKIWGAPVMNYEDPARRPTGCYLAPGSIAEVIVPDSLVNKGFNVRVGAHSWDLEKKPLIKRLDRVSIVYPIKETRTFIANPLGGGIYIEVPYLANEGQVTVKVQNAVRSPYFSARSFDTTPLEAWKKTERHHPGPWADFESDKFMMQVPSSWIADYDDPATLMQDWDKAMDAVSELFGRPLVQSKTVLYVQVDVIMRGNANFPGYPQSNTPYNPHKPDGNSSQWLLKGPQYAPGEITFHELGHAHFFSKFTGELEAVVNLPYVPVLNRKFGVDLDTAFGRSFNLKQMTLDQAAITWMVTENFRNGKPMDISNKPGDEVKYQYRGYGKYVEIANLFGWDVLGRFWKGDNERYQPGDKVPQNQDPTDPRIFRLSQTAGADLRPLIHFWGIQPENNAALQKKLETAGLKPSALIYDRLVHYKSVIPMSNDDFVKHAKSIYPKGIGKGQSPFYGEGWYHAWLPQYNESHGKAAQAALQEIIELYFPKGRPANTD
jgi:hypothetical protein